jgi:signal transduction histidine kinase
LKSRPLLLAFTVVVLAAVAVIQANDLRWLRRQAYADAERRAASQAKAIAEYIRGAFAAADSSLRQIAVHSRRIGGPSAPSGEWVPILEAAQAALAERGSLSVTDAAGIIRHTTLPEILGSSRQEHYLYQHLSRTSDDALVLDVPFTSPVRPDRWIVPVGRRLSTADGRFEGMVVQVITAENFRPFLEAIRIGSEGVIKLFHPSGALIIQQPGGPTPPPDDGAADPLFARVGAGRSGLANGPLSADGPGFVSAFHRVEGPRLLVTVSLSEREFLTDWRSRLRRSILEFLGLAGVMAVLGTFVLRQIRLRSRMEQALVEVQRTEAARLRDTNAQLAAALERETQARQESEVAGRLKDEFLMTLSHELRTPLNAILGWLHILGTNIIDDEQRGRALATIERNARAQARLIEDLLDVSRAISGKLQISPRPVDLREVVQAAAATLQPAMAARGIVYRARFDEPLPLVSADPDRMQQVVWNLLSNAIKFSPAGGEVEVATRSTAEGIELVVRDHGTGIAGEFLPFVFDRFRQADAGPRREHGGLGLGLSIVRHLVELHGGRVSAHSEGEGRGSTFTVILPAIGPRSAGL